MVSSENKVGLYIAIPVYFVFLFGAALWAYFRMKGRKAQLEAKGLEEDALSAHYLGSRSFGPVLTAATMFASLFSGYTLVGVPNEAFRIGWLALRWIPSALFIVLGYMGTGPRLRKASVVRNHQSPSDFITDRFRSQILRYTTVLMQVFPAVIYLTAQCVAIQSTFNFIFGINPNSPVAVLIISALILIFEWMGGLSSVAVTDAVQGTVMVVCFVILPFVVLNNFGGWKDLDWRTYPQQGFYQTPSGDEQWLFWNFAVVNFGFFSLPHLLQRTYSAENLKALKFGYKVLAVSPWLTILPGIFLGTVGVQMLADVESVSSPFAAILRAIMDLGGFPYAVGVITFTASLAAIMSTADSLLIAISQIITEGVIYPLCPQATPSQITNFGRFTSFCSMAVALLIALLAGQGISDLAVIQFSISLQIVPAFLVGLFATSKMDCHPYTLTTGIWSGFLSIFLIHFMYMSQDGEISSIPLNSGVTGFAINIAVCIILEAIRRLCSSGRKNGKRSIGNEMGDNSAFAVSPGGGQQLSSQKHAWQPDWDVPKLSRFGEVPLTADLMWKVMRGVTEPLVQPWFPILMFMMTLLITPLVASDQPPLDAEGNLAFPPGVVNGIPSWAFKVIVMSILLTVMLMMGIRTIPDEFPDDEKLAMGADLPDPNAMELSQAELGTRVAFDASNRASIKWRIPAGDSIRTSILEEAVADRNVVLRSSRASDGEVLEPTVMTVSGINSVEEQFVEEFIEDLDGFEQEG